jgi:outer membrane protein OmpA-like peptidoglycan-associated protein
MTMSTVRTVGIWSALALGSVACATTRPPEELVQARQAYETSEQSDAKRYSPASLHEAKTALDRAERLFQEEDDSPEVRDAAYVAARRAERAKVEGETLAMKQNRELSAREAQKAQAKAAEQAQTELQSTKQALQSETQARQQAEQRAQDALKQLEQTQAASVKQEERGTVITVAGAFLFPSNKATLLPAANAKLDQIATVLQQQPDKKILIEGHTDSTGSAALNAELSKARAEAVASYLSSRGIARENLTTEGIGPNRPIASNDSPEGRATNRRVEITVLAQ